MKTIRVLVLLVLTEISTGMSAHAVDHSVVTPYVADDVLAIGYLDLTAVDMPALVKELRGFGVLAPAESDDWGNRILRLGDGLNALAASGVTRAYALLRVSDFEQQGPVWVLALADGTDQRAVSRLLARSLATAADTPFAPRVYKHADGLLLAAMNNAQLEQFAARRVDEPRAEAVTALAKLGDHKAGLAVLGDADSRRVVREMLPRLPSPFQSVDGRLVADDLLWGCLGVDFPPQPAVSVHIETSGDDVARTLRQSIAEGLAFTTTLLTKRLQEGRAHPPAGDTFRLQDLLKLRSDGAALTMRWSADADGTARLRRLVGPQLDSARRRAERTRRINQFRQLGLALLNYESAAGHFAEQAIYDKAGQPLLSWRVHVLPYLDQQALYSEFHLDEPWDSPHNRQLVQRMPAVFADPDASVRRAAGPGRTTFVAPVGEGTLFPPRESLPDGEPLRLRDVKDGVSKTILFLEVVPERAVVWTKPEDWLVNLDHPLQGVERSDRSGFTAVFCDCHVRYMPAEITARQFLALLTRSGGD